MHKRRWIYFAFAVVNILGFYFLLLHMDRQFAGDWDDYFGPLSLFTRSSIWHYATFPLHHPWRCGGSDLIVNPQTRFFSPFGLLDVLFTPQWAILSTMMLFGFLGSISMFKLLTSMKVKEMSAAIGAVLFVNCSWFALHFTEGHLTYCEMQLLPAILYCVKKLEERRSQFLLMSVLALMVLDGAIQAFLYAVLVFLCGLIIFPESVKTIGKSSPRYLGKLAALFFLVTSIKTIPVWITLSKRPPMLDRTVMSSKLLFTSLLYPWQEFRMAVTNGLPYVFHEFGCYLGWTALLLVVYFATKAQWRKANWRIAAVFLFWLWTGSGWGHRFNPWLLLQRIPVFNQAHLQSRLFIIMFLFFILLVARSLDLVSKKAVFVLLSLLLVFESSFVRLHITNFFNYPFSDTAPGIHDFIQSTNLTSTVKQGIKVAHSFKLNTGALDCNERAFFPSEAKSIDDKDYKGEIFLTSGTGKANLEGFVPGSIQMHYETATDSTVAVNTNNLWGWKTDSPSAHVISKRFGDILQISVPKGQGNVRLDYHPVYLIPCLMLYFLGCILYLQELRRVWR